MLRHRWTVLGAVGLSTGCSLSWLALGSSVSPGPQVALVVVAVVAYGVAIAACLRADRPGARIAVLVASGCLLVAAVALAPRDSNDVWGYVGYARVLTDHGDNPYETPPSDHPDDALYSRMSEEYRPMTTVYGPFFTAISAVGTMSAGDHPLANRLFFQTLAAATAAITLVLVDRRTRGDPAALALVGLSPAMIALVNGAHPDLLVGVLLLAAVVLAASRRAAVVGLVISAAILVKVVAVVPAAAIIVWSWRRLGARAAAVTSAVTVGIVTASYALVGGVAALQPVRDARLFGTRGQAWEIVRSRWSDALAADGVRDAAELAHQDVARFATPLIVVVVALALWRYSNRRDAAQAVTGAGLGYLLVAPYVLPWYSGWVLPTAAVTIRRTPLAVLACVQSLLVLLVYAQPPGQLPDEGVLLDLSTDWLPVAGIALAVAFVVVTFVAPRSDAEAADAES